MARVSRLLALTLAPALALGACQRAPDLGAEQGWVRLAAVPGRPAAGYLTLRGGPTDATLVGASSPAVRRIELHESMATGHAGMQGMTMRPLGQVAVPAGASVAFAPSGRHLMLFDVAPGVRPGGTIRLTLSFADGRTVPVDARAVAAGDPPPAF